MPRLLQSLPLLHLRSETRRRLLFGNGLVDRRHRPQIAEDGLEIPIGHSAVLPPPHKRVQRIALGIYPRADSAEIVGLGPAADPSLEIGREVVRVPGKGIGRIIPPGKAAVEDSPRAQT